MAGACAELGGCNDRSGSGGSCRRLHGKKQWAVGPAGPAQPVPSASRWLASDGHRRTIASEEGPTSAYEGGPGSLAPVTQHEEEDLTAAYAATCPTLHSQARSFCSRFLRLISRSFLACVGTQGRPTNGVRPVRRASCPRTWGYGGELTRPMQRVGRRVVK